MVERDWGLSLVLSSFSVTIVKIKKKNLQLQHRQKKFDGIISKVFF
jgi:hypothetical protein